jgi:glycosyltransferase involved in cell wall biosynthesis
MTRKIDSLYICPWSLNDPLCRSQSLAYLQGLAERGYNFALITFEADQYRIPADEQSAVSARLQEEGIFWYPVDWPAGNSITDKFKGIRSVVLQGIRVCWKHRPQLIHSRSSLPVFASVTLSKLFRTKFLYDADSLLSDEYLDIGHISRESRAYKFLAWSERWARCNADRIIVLTDRLRSRYLSEFRIGAPIDVIPCCVDTGKFRFDREARRGVRDELGLGKEIVLAYVGKAGSWYLVEETFGFFKSLNSAYPSSRLLVISRDEPEVFRKIARDAGVAEDLYFLRSSGYDQIPRWLSGADLALSLIRQVPSKIGSSPVKFAEYLSVGLPVVTTDLIGDCSKIVLEDKVGIVLKQTDQESYDIGSQQALALLEEPKDTIAARSVASAEKHFSVQNVGIEKYIEIYGSLLT